MGRARTSPEPLLDVAEIQGNILAGFSKDHQRLVALAIRDRNAARRWLGRVAPGISTTAEVLQFNRLFKAQRARLGADPPGLVATWVNIAFSHGGFAALTSAAVADAVPDGPFREGLAARAAILGDPPGTSAADPAADWVVGGTGRIPDILVIVASDDPSRLDKVCDAVRPNAGDGAGAPEVMWEELGESRPDKPGHEHFGFRDGLSQPAVRGLVARRPDVLLSPRILAAPPDGQVPFARPGQPLIWPGQFVFGYPSTDGSGGSGGGPVPVPRDLPVWLRNGSLLVFRRLRQDVAGFTRFIGETAARLAQTAMPDLTPEGLGALLVGRWASGAPISRASQADVAGLAQDSLANNDFLFTSDTPPPVFLPGVPPSAQAFPAAVADVRGLVCPHAAHIRKMNPRDQDSDLGDQFDTLTRRVLRRGILYGPPLADPAHDDRVDRGLHFLCYQTSIEGQFEVLQQNWANRREVPTPGGHDPIIGQAVGDLEVELLTRDGNASELVSIRTFVRPTGGGYFFSPSIRAIAAMVNGTLR
jgi:Dyp-type peroxidase family